MASDTGITYRHNAREQEVAAFIYHTLQGSCGLDNSCGRCWRLRNNMPGTRRYLQTKITVTLTRRGLVVADPGSSTSIYNESIRIAALSGVPLDVHDPSTK